MELHSGTEAKTTRIAIVISWRPLADGVLSGGGGGGGGGGGWGGEGAGGLGAAPSTPRHPRPPPPPAHPSPRQFRARCLSFAFLPALLPPPRGGPYWGFLVLGCRGAQGGRVGGGQPLRGDGFSEGLFGGRKARRRKCRRGLPPRGFAKGRGNGRRWRPLKKGGVGGGAGLGVMDRPLESFFYLWRSRSPKGCVPLSGRDAGQKSD